jgi:hypothetical protein
LKEHLRCLYFRLKEIKIVAADTAKTQITIYRLYNTMQCKTVLYYFSVTRNVFTASSRFFLGHAVA